MKTFRGLVKSHWYKSFIEKKDGSVWWTNHECVLKDDPEMFKYFKKKGLDEKSLIGKINEGKSYLFGFEKGSRGFSGIKFDKEIFNGSLAGLLRKYGEKKSEEFLSEIPIKKLEFSLNHWVRGRKLFIDKDINNYISENLFPTELHEQEGVCKYFKEDELVAIYTGALLDRAR